MQAIHPQCREALYSIEDTQAIERQAAALCPPHQLMARAGWAVAQLARALAPHARCIWVACGPGNNGGDGLVAATHLHQWAQARGGWPQVVVTHGTGPHPRELPHDAQHALEQAQAAGVRFTEHPPEVFDLAIDAVFGIGLTRALEGGLVLWMERLRGTPNCVLSVDVPSGLHANTGTWMPWRNAPHGAPGPRHTLSLLTLKPGLFTASGRDAAGQIWFDDLHVTPPPQVIPVAQLNGCADPSRVQAHWPHASHKGRFGDVIVLGGQDITVDGSGMTGAAVLAARAALHAGAGRVYVGLLQGATAPADHTVRWDPAAPELMFRSATALLASPLLSTAAVVCGCGGGTAVAPLLPQVLAGAHTLVLDADALNAIAGDPALQALLVQRGARGAYTVLTPHPLEAARLLGVSTAEVMSDRLQAAQTLSDRFDAVCVLKGSGSIISAPKRIPRINPTGNAALATAGTGDVLAGMLGSALAQPELAPEQRQRRLDQAVFQHGWLADQWLLQSAEKCADTSRAPTLTASRLAKRIHPIR